MSWSKKGATSLTIILLVIMTLVLWGVAIVGFMTNHSDTKIIGNSRAVEKIYIEEGELSNFIISLAPKFSNSLNEEEIRAGIKEALANYTLNKNYRNLVILADRISRGDYKISFGSGFYTLEFENIQFIINGLPISLSHDFNFKIKKTMGSSY